MLKNLPKTKLGVKARTEFTEGKLLVKLCALASKEANKIVLDTKISGETKYSVVGKSSKGGQRTFYSVKHIEASNTYEIYVKGKKVSLGPKNSKRLFKFTKSQDDNRKSLDNSLVGENKKWSLFSWLKGRSSK